MWDVTAVRLGATESAAFAEIDSCERRVLGAQPLHASGSSHGDSGGAVVPHRVGRSRIRAGKTNRDRLSSWRGWVLSSAVRRQGLDEHSCEFYSVIGWGQNELALPRVNRRLSEAILALTLSCRSRLLLRPGLRGGLATFRQSSESRFQMS